MTNFEKYKDEILNISREGSLIGKKGNTLYSCRELSCEICDFSSGEGPCIGHFLKWCYKEYKEPAPKLTKGEHGLCEYLKTGYIARDLDDKLFFHTSLPMKNFNDWSAYDYDFTQIKDDTFTFIKWEDEEPWSIEDLLKLEIEE